MKRLLRLLVIDHSCVVAVNQAVYAEVARVKQWAVDLIVPHTWVYEHGARQTGVPRWPAFKGEIVELPVIKAGHFILHTYRSSLGRVFRRLKPDVIFLHNEPYAVSTLQALLANRASVRRPIGFFSAQNIVKRFPFPFSAAERLVFRMSDFAMPCAEEVQGVLRRKGYHGPSAVVPFGLDPDVYRPRPEAATALRRHYLRAGETILMGYVGRLVEEKGLATLIAAVGRIKDDKTWRLLIVGSGSFEAPMRAAIAAAALDERITLVNAVPHEQVPAYLSALDLTVVPSETRPNWREQFGRIVIEGMACGSVVVGSDSGEIPHLIRSTGGGVIFPEADPAALAEALRSLLNDAQCRARLGETGRRSASEQFSLTRVAEQFADVVESARVGGRRRA